MQSQDGREMEKRKSSNTPDQYKGVSRVGVATVPLNVDIRLLLHHRDDCCGFLIYHPTRSPPGQPVPGPADVFQVSLVLYSCIPVHSSESVPP